LREGQALRNNLRFQFWRFRDWMADRVLGAAHRRRVFHRIYAQNLWGDAGSASGGGSGPAATAVIRQQLPALLRDLKIDVLLDAPCGDFAWAGDLAGTVNRYLGVDIVPALIEQNRRRYGNDRISFLCADLSRDPLPRADLILSRDCFIHLPTRMIRGALRNFRASGTPLLLLSNSPGAPSYLDIPLGSFRPIDFRQPPFSFPAPLRTVEEHVAGDRQLCLWALASLPID
jgi:hypothetical protein